MYAIFNIQPRSKAFKHFLNRKKNIRSNGTEMVLNEKIFRIIKFPDTFLLKKRQPHRAGVCVCVFTMFICCTNYYVSLRWYKLSALPIFFSFLYICV